MPLSTDLQSWYLANDDSTMPGNTMLNADEPALAQTAFQAAMKVFFPNAAPFSTGNESQQPIRLAESVDSVREIVSNSMTAYENSKKHTKVRKWLARCATGLNFYANVMDMLVQHHPEYVSLVWGAMKALIVAVVNHEKVLILLAKALSEIGESLPRVELATILYPTERMGKTVEKLYSLILKFFLRANNWYKESTLTHIIHSITRPAELHYMDLLEKIGECSRSVDQLALSGSQAELRDMHSKINLILSRLDGTETNMKQLMTQMSASQALVSSAFLDTNQQLSDIQFSQIISYLSNDAVLALQDARRHHLLMQRRLSPQDRKRVIEPLRSSAKLQSWASSNQSAMILLRTSFRQRQTVKSFIVSISEKLRDANLPCIEALPGACSSSQERCKTSIDLLKYLVVQALTIDDVNKNERSMGLNCRQCSNAVTEEDWFKLFRQVVSKIRRPIYVLVDIGSAGSTDDGPNPFSWPTAFLTCIQSLQEHGFKGSLKVLLLSWGPHSLLYSMDQSLKKSTIVIRDGHTRFLRSRSLPRHTTFII